MGREERRVQGLDYPQVCPELNANEIQIPYDKHHKVSSLVKSHQNTQFSQLLRNMKMSNMKYYLNNTCVQSWTLVSFLMHLLFSFQYVTAANLQQLTDSVSQRH